MKAMVLRKLSKVAEGTTPLEAADLPDPRPGKGEILIRVTTCGVCHTELDEIEGRTPPPRLPVVPGHQVVGRVAAHGEDASLHRLGDRVGVGWIYSSCGHCEYCLRGEENLCAEFRATGRDANGGYAEYMVVPEAYATPIPKSFADLEAAPLLCAGAVGYRALRLTNLVDGQRIGLTGFGASGHLVLQMIRGRFPAARIFVFSRSEGERNFARELGALWAGDIGDEPPEKLHAAIDTTPVWRAPLEALKNLAPGGRLVVNVIRKEDVDKDALLSLDYTRDLWLEREIKSVANVTRRDIAECLALAAELGLKPEVEEFPLRDANRALLELRSRKIRGAKVLRVASE